MEREKLELWMVETDDDLEAEFGATIAESRQHDGDSGSWDWVLGLKPAERDELCQIRASIYGGLKRSAYADLPDPPALRL